MVLGDFRDGHTRRIYSNQNIKGTNLRNIPISNLGRRIGDGGRRRSSLHEGIMRLGEHKPRRKKKRKGRKEERKGKEKEKEVRREGGRRR